MNFIKIKLGNMVILINVNYVLESKTKFIMHTTALINLNKILSAKSPIFN
jgi:hypothetical protein